MTVNLHPASKLHHTSGTFGGGRSAAVFALQPLSDANFSMLRSHSSYNGRSIINQKATNKINIFRWTSHPTADRKKTNRNQPWNGTINAKTVVLSASYLVLHLLTLEKDAVEGLDEPLLGLLLAHAVLDTNAARLPPAGRE